MGLREQIELVAEVWEGWPRCWVRQEEIGAATFYRFLWGRQQVGLLRLVEVIDGKSSRAVERTLEGALGWRGAIRPVTLPEAVSYLDSWAQERFSGKGGRS